MAEIAVLGHGVVGSGVLEVLLTHGDSISKRAKEEIHVKRILDLREFPHLPYSGIFTKDFSSILNDPDIRIVWRSWGAGAGLFLRQGVPGKRQERGHLQQGAGGPKGRRALGPGPKEQPEFLFEASVGGGIPIIRPISQCLAANEVTEIAGILNGTTNFILTKMIREGMAFSDALALAQQLGYAERGPFRRCGGRRRLPEDLHPGVPGLRHPRVPGRGSHRGHHRHHPGGRGLRRRLGRGHQAHRRGENAGERETAHPGFAHVHLRRASLPMWTTCSTASWSGGTPPATWCLREGGGQAPHRQRRGGRCDRLRAAPALQPENPLLGGRQARLYRTLEDTPQDVFVRVAGEGDPDSLFDRAQAVFPEAQRLIRRDEAPGEAGFTLSQVSESQLRGGPPP